MSLRPSLARMVTLGALAGCEVGQATALPSPGLERMLRQPRAEAYTRSPLDDGPAMRPPPAGTVAWDQPVGLSITQDGTVDGGYSDTVPVAITRARMDTGRARFDTFCAPCHGITGDGVSIVARAMSVRRPPSLHDPRYRAYAVGRLYQTVTQGYGLMPGYAWQLTVDERWAVVAYVRALQRSQYAPVATLPADVQRTLAAVAP